MQKNEFTEGFTLIELLVVVLIIGILAAIALPQYRKIIYKTKFTQAIFMVNRIHKAQQEYYAIHEKYAGNFSSLNIDLPPTNGTPTNYAFWDWGYCFTFQEYCGCGFNGARIFKWYSSNNSYCLAEPTDYKAQEICEAATGKNSEQRSLSGGNYYYSF